MMDARMELRPGSAARFVGIGALILFLCWQHVQATRLGYQVEKTRRDALERRGRVAALRMELDTRLSPEKIAVRAAAMGLVPASVDSLRRLETGPASAPAGLFALLRARSFRPFSGTRS